MPISDWPADSAARYERRGPAATPFTWTGRARSSCWRIVCSYTTARESWSSVTTHRLPGVYAYRELVEAGGLMSFGPSYAGMHRRAAYFVDRILKGASPSALPVERPTKFELVINLKAAKALGLTIPPSLLGRADEVIQ